MKIRLWAAVVIFISGYAPLAWILVLMDYNFAGSVFAHPAAVAWLFGISVFSIAVLTLTIWQLRGEVVVEVVEVSDCSHEFLNYALPYISSFAIGDVLEKLSNGLAVLAFLALVGAVSISTQIVLINPLLAVFGFRLYELKVKDGKNSYSRFLLSRHPPEEGGKIKVCALSHALLFGEKPFSP